MIVAGVHSGASQWIRLHREARECPLARRIGCMLFGVSFPICQDLVGRDVFGRLGISDSAFGNWGGDLTMVGEDVGLAQFLGALSGLETLPKSAWERELRAASCLPTLIEAIRSRNPAQLHSCIVAANRTDWDAICHGGLSHGPHASANRIRRWLATVTAGVTPDWDEGFSLFNPLQTR